MWSSCKVSSSSDEADRSAEMTEPEVHVRSVRRRRSDPPMPPLPRPPNIRNWLIYLGIAALISALMLDGFLSHRPEHPPLPRLSYAAEVRSALFEAGESLQVVVSWDLTLADSGGAPDSVLVKVLPAGRPNITSTRQRAGQLADTVYLPIPSKGETLAGSSCVATWHDDITVDESCTPWQYVRPSAATAASVNQIVIKPSGLQIDPDVGGRCAEWQRSHPNQSVWLRVNVTAVPECTGPNRKPAVAQFCAFAVLPDGRRVKTASSSNSPYCEELFVEWSRELYS
jgi:hypothetical protein